MQLSKFGMFVGYATFALTTSNVNKITAKDGEVILKDAPEPI